MFLVQLFCRNAFAYMCGVITSMSQLMPSHVWGLFLLTLLTGCTIYQKRECSIFITVESQHAADLAAVVTPSVEQALVSAGYKKHWDDIWVRGPQRDLVKLKKESENPFVVNVYFWDDPGSYASCSIRSASIKKYLEQYLLSNHVPAAVREAIPVD
ncbi:MAG: hypothetical protein JWM78_1578 [Verrucomicrobiaceae bacterium]|nr:hypothetical protein [Verrucomicrobiaceae bacterium]